MHDNTGSCRTARGVDVGVRVLVFVSLLCGCAASQEQHHTTFAIAGTYTVVHDASERSSSLCMNTSYRDVAVTYLTTDGQTLVQFQQSRSSHTSHKIASIVITQLSTTDCCKNVLLDFTQPQLLSTDKSTRATTAAENSSVTTFSCTSGVFYIRLVDSHHTITSTYLVTYPQLRVPAPAEPSGSHAVPNLLNFTTYVMVSSGPLPGSVAATFAQAPAGWYRDGEKISGYKLQLWDVTTRKYVALENNTVSAKGWTQEPFMFEQVVANHTYQVYISLVFTDSTLECYSLYNAGCKASSSPRFYCRGDDHGCRDVLPDPLKYPDLGAAPPHCTAANTEQKSNTVNIGLVVIFVIIMICTVVVVLVALWLAVKRLRRWRGKRYHMRLQGPIDEANDIIQQLPGSSDTSFTSQHGDA